MNSGTIKRAMYILKRFGMSGIITTWKLNKEKITAKEYEKVWTIYEQKYLKKIYGNEKIYKKEVKKWFGLFAANEGGSGDIEQPITFNEKIQWLKLYGNRSLMTKLADKYEVRDWVISKIGEQYLIPFLGVWDKSSEIDFDSLPNQFAIKANHGCGMNIIVKDKSKMDKERVCKQLDEWLAMRYGFRGMETQYFDIRPRIIAEKFIQQLDGNLYDYKVHCFNGEPKYIQVIGDREKIPHSVFMDMNWKVANILSGDYSGFEHDLEKPEQFDEMMDLSRRLSKDFQYVRVDWYIIEGKVMFGEMTFTPYAGMYNWKPKGVNRMLGDLIKL